MLNAVELFAGAGGLGLGVSLAGFKPKAIVEWDRWAADTISENISAGFPIVRHWPFTQGDVREFDFDSLEDRIDLVTGGPPCQPFSIGGKHRAHNDDRDMFPTTVEVVRKLRPKAFIVENVKGLTRATFSNYFNYILLQFSYPEITRRTDEDVSEHLARLEKMKSSGKHPGLTYEVIPRLVNAANYGVPQKRERVFIVGFRHDLGIKWSFPEETHSLDALIESQWVTEKYWDKHNIPNRGRGEPASRMEKRIKQIREANERPSTIHKPWRTVRDALSDMPDPRIEQSLFADHRYQSGARSYPGHTGSPLDLPSKALKAGVHGVPGGENMMVMADGDVRYFTVREAARIQTFPDGYKFHGSWSETMRQLGNAVPVRLAHIVAASVAEKLILQDGHALKKQIQRLARQ